jgi:hypothetical protein
MDPSAVAWVEIAIWAHWGESEELLGDYVVAWVGPWVGQWADQVVGVTLTTMRRPHRGQ